MAKIHNYKKSNVRNPVIMFAAFDTETDGLGGKLLSIQCGAENERNFLTGPDMLDNFFAFLADYPKPYIHYAHFAQYDWRYILDYMEQNKIKCEMSMRTERDIYQIKVFIADSECIMRDSFALWPGTLADLSKSFCPHLPKLEIDIANFDENNPAHIKYAMRDIEILLTGLPKLNELIQETFDVSINATTASTALKSWQHTLDPKEIYNGAKGGVIEDFTRQAYYGGIVFLTTTRLSYDCETYDINSSYPYVMSEFDFPDGVASSSKNYGLDKFGIYKCRVRSPNDLVIPIIPARDSWGRMRWLSGEFDTVCTNVELIFAAKHGYEIIKIYEGIVFSSRVTPFANFVNKCKSVRKEYKGRPQEAIAKLMQNSLYGKFGSRRERVELFHPETQKDSIGAYPFNNSEYWYTRTMHNDDMLVKPEWAVFITAFARIRLLETAYAVGVENVLYGDTDSLTVYAGNSENIDCGVDYGQFKLEKRW
ncbi:MAG: DNA polymerase, partial [Gammaproteobacteria bacterium]